MPVFNNMNEIFSFIGTGIIVPVIKEEIGEYYTLIYKFAIDRTVYNKPSNSDYVRTYAMRNSVSYEIEKDPNGDIIIYIGADPAKMSNNYSSWTGTPSDNRQNISNWLDGGHKGTYYTKSGSWTGTPSDINYTGRQFNEIALAIIAGGIRDTFWKALKSRGYNVTKRVNEKGRDTRVEEKDFDYIK